MNFDPSLLTHQAPLGLALLHAVLAMMIVMLVGVYVALTLDACMKISMMIWKVDERDPITPETLVLSAIAIPLTVLLLQLTTLVAVIWAVFSPRQ